MFLFISQYITDLLQNSNSRYNQSRMAGRARLSLSHTVLLSLTLLSKRLSYRSVSTSFRLEKGNIHRIFFSFCERVNTLEDQQIRWPTGMLTAVQCGSIQSVIQTFSAGTPFYPPVFLGTPFPPQ